MGHDRSQRYNARARGLLNGSAPPTATKRNADVADTNYDIVETRTPTSVAREADDRSGVEPSHTSSSSSSRKRKRLEKYITKKLKAEKRANLLKDLAVSSVRDDGALGLGLTSSLGTGRVRTGAQTLDRRSQLAERKRERARAFIVDHQRGYHSSTDDDTDGIDGSRSGSGSEPPGAPGPAPPPPPPRGVSPVSTAVGSGLRSFGNDRSAPIIVVKPKRARSTWRRRAAAGSPSGQEEGASSFDSSDATAEEGEEGSGGDLGLGSASDVDDDDASSWHGISDEERPAAQSVDPRRPNGIGGFKAWAQAQLDAAKGLATPGPSSSIVQKSARPPPHTTRPVVEAKGPLGELIEPYLPSSLLTGPRPPIQDIKPVRVDRPDAVQEARLKLPIVAEEETIMDAIRQSSVVIICGETGSGKTTQVPQFLYENGFGDKTGSHPGIIAITQPRRVAAVSMASRVAEELAVPPPTVAHQIRYDATTSATTAITFMTDGVLLRELSTDLLLSKYSVVIIDEAHERTLNTDILIGVLSRAVRLREEDWRANKPGAPGPLRLIVMSATLRVSDFCENRQLFAKVPPVIHIPTRQHPVSIHFSRKTRPDYLSEAYSKVCKIHTRLPPGGILVFLTSQQEIHALCRKLEKRFGKRALDARRNRRDPSRTQPAINEVGVHEHAWSASAGMVEVDDIDADPQAPLAPDVDAAGIDAADDSDNLDSSEDDEGAENAELQIFDDHPTDDPMHILPLYSLLSTDKQMRVFHPPPDGSRLVVVATNVAETSLTIPNIRYVVDCGRAKERHYDAVSGVQSFQVNFVSKASAAQRAGRAGRTGPGHCYRLYSSTVFETAFAEFAEPEILRMPIDGIVLQMKAMGLTRVSHFPFPTAPDPGRLAEAEKLLARLGALDMTKMAEITTLGRKMSDFPIFPRFSRMLVSAVSHRDRKVLPYVVAIICALSVGEIFERENIVATETTDSPEDDALDMGGQTDVIDEATLRSIKNPDVRARELRKLTRRRYFEAKAIFEKAGNYTSDVFSALAAVCAFEYESPYNRDAFCNSHFLRPKAMTEVHKLRIQIGRLLQDVYPGRIDHDHLELLPPSDTQLHTIRQLITAAFSDKVAIRKDIWDSTSIRGLANRDIPYRAVGISEDVFLDPQSTVCHGLPPDTVTFAEVTRSSKTWLRGITRIDKSWLADLAAALCTVNIVPEKHAAAASRSDGSTTRPCTVRRTFDAGGLDIDLGVESRTQRLDDGRWVLV